MIEINGKRYMIGDWQAEVVSDVDPSNHRRVKVRVYAIHGDDTPASDLPFARCCVSHVGNNTGEKPRPNVGQKIFVSFEQGDPDFPIWRGGFLEEDDAPNGPKVERIDGKHTLEVKQDQSVKVDRTQSLTVGLNQNVEVKGTSTQQFKEVEQIVIDGKRLTIGRRETAVIGNDQLDVQGSLVWTVIGDSKMTFAASQSMTIAGTLRQLILEQAIIKAMNVGSLPTESALLLESINGGVKALARSIAGIEGASLNLDPLGALTSLKSLVSLSVESPVTRIGPTAAAATVPVCTLPHTHLAFGIPTTPAVLGPGTPLSVLGPAL